MDFKNKLKEKSEIIENELKKYFSLPINKFEGKIYDGMRYSLLSGGKRIRPILLIESGFLFGADISDSIEFACALEMIHTYSLIHDDLPSMDDDDYRRGKLTNHKVYGQGMAILAGDALLNSSFEIMIKKAIETFEFKYLKSLEVISNASGVKGMIGGQVGDIMSEGNEFSKETLDYIHKNKTGAILIAAVLAGGYIGGATENEIKLLEELGLNIGLVFQIKDDILDIESSYEKLGKPIGSDEKNKKLTYPSLYGLKESKEKVISLSERSYEILAEFKGDTTFLKDLIDFLNIRDH